jgi:iron-sulfur cluster assembly protein
MAEPYYVRVRVVPGGCNGYQFKLGVEPEIGPEDQAFRAGGVQVVVARRQVEMLRGTEVDYVEKDDARGFKINSPKWDDEATRKQWLAELDKEPREE